MRRQETGDRRQGAGHRTGERNGYLMLSPVILHFLSPFFAPCAINSDTEPKNREARGNRDVTGVRRGTLPLLLFSQNTPIWRYPVKRLHMTWMAAGLLALAASSPANAQPGPRWDRRGDDQGQWQREAPRGPQFAPHQAGPRFGPPQQQGGPRFGPPQQQGGPRFGPPQQQSGPRFGPPRHQGGPRFGPPPQQGSRFQPPMPPRGRGFEQPGPRHSNKADRKAAKKAGKGKKHGKEGRAEAHDDRRDTPRGPRPEARDDDDRRPAPRGPRPEADERDDRPRRPAPPFGRPPAPRSDIDELLNDAI